MIHANTTSTQYICTVESLLHAFLALDGSCIPPRDRESPEARPRQSTGALLRPNDLTNIAMKPDSLEILFITFAIHMYRGMRFLCVTDASVPTLQSHAAIVPMANHQQAVMKSRRRCLLEVHQLIITKDIASFDTQRTRRS